MSLKKRVERLEKMHSEPDGLSGVLWYLPEAAIIVDGKKYSAIEDIPLELRMKHPSLIVGKVIDGKGERVDVTAPVVGEGSGFLLVPKRMNDEEWREEASEVKKHSNKKEINHG